MTPMYYEQIRMEEAYLHLPEYHDLPRELRVKLHQMNREDLIVGRTAVLLARDFIADDPFIKWHY